MRETNPVLMTLLQAVDETSTAYRMGQWTGWILIVVIITLVVIMVLRKTKK